MYSPYSAFDNNPVYYSDPSGADKGSNLFGEFNSFVNRIYGRSSLTNLFENNSEKTITETIDKWWAGFEEYRGKKEERTETFLEGLEANLNNYSEGTYIYNGKDWVKKN